MGSLRDEHSPNDDFLNELTKELVFGDATDKNSVPDHQRDYLERFSFTLALPLLTVFSIASTEDVSKSKAMVNILLHTLDKAASFSYIVFLAFLYY